jgi:tripartite-type tricarboxylate transporter receptor subunit TctC
MILVCDHFAKQNKGVPMKRGFWAPVALIAACVLAASSACAADWPAKPIFYPNRPVTVVVPYAPGGVTDLFARVLSHKLEQRLGRPFVVENRPGASAITAATAVAHAAPDGYTLMMASSTPMALNVTVHKHLPYDPTTELTPVALIARVPFVLVVNPSLPIHSVDDIVKRARERPGQVSYGTPGPGTFHHLNAELLKSIFKLDMVQIPYKGTLPALNDVIGGHIELMFSDVPPALPLIRASKLTAIGVTTAQRVPAAPDLPPLAEVGVPGFDSASWHMVATTGKTPNEVVVRLYEELRVIMSDPAVVEGLVRDGAIPLVSPPPDELKAFVRSEIIRWGKVVEKAGIAGSE